MIVTRLLPLLTGVAIFAAMLSSPSYAADDARFDIAGLKLGMSPDEVRQALAAYGVAQSDIQEASQHYSYSDGIKHDFTTDDFISFIGGSIRTQGNQNTDSFKVYFSPPPDGGRVVAITRNVKNQVDPPSVKQYQDALYEKYGPTIAHKNANISQWMFGQGTMNCIGSQYGEFGLPVNTGGILAKVFHTVGSEILTDRFRNGKVKNLQECANMLQYELPRYVPTATSVTATMIDTQSWVKAELAAGAMVESLRQDAIKKRAGNSAKPAL